MLYIHLLSEEFLLEQILRCNLLIDFILPHIPSTTSANKQDLAEGLRNWDQSPRWVLYQCWVEGKDLSLTHWKNSSPCNPNSFSPRAHCWLTFIFLSSRTPRSFSAQLLFRGLALKYDYMGSFLGRFKTLHFPQLNSMRFFSALSKCDMTLRCISQSSHSRQTFPGH